MIDTEQVSTKNDWLKRGQRRIPEYLLMFSDLFPDCEHCTAIMNAYYDYRYVSHPKIKAVKKISKRQSPSTKGGI
jgi:hypothetical protein